VLVGYSAGGALANAVARRLEMDRARPLGVVMIDTYLPEPHTWEAVLSLVIERLLDRPEESVTFTDDDLLAMAAYTRMFRDWEPVPVRTPQLLVKASKPLSPDLDDARRLPGEETPDGVVEVVADHFSIIEEDVAATAQAASAWIGEKLAARRAPVQMR
jgi:thioesterase domain-containing protein